MTHQNLLVWADKQLAWGRDALRRHALSPNFELNAEDKSAVIKRVRLAAGIGYNQDCDNTPFTGGDLHGGSITSPRTILVRWVL